MKRRSFLQSSSVATLPLMVNGLNVSAITKSSLFNYINNDSDKVLVLVQLNGGNDGLQTIIPLDQYDKLANARQNIIVPENSILSLTDEIGLHPAMSGIKSLYEEAKMNIIQDVGYPNQNRSHFRSTDIWTSGSAADVFDRTGWLGRYFDTQHPGYPEGFPNEDCPDPIALTLGYVVSETCQGLATNFSGAVTDPFSASNLFLGEDGQVDVNTCYGTEIGFLRTAIEQTNAYSERIVAAANNGTNLAAYPENNPLAEQLRTVALLIAGGLQTKVYVVTLGGFDTHANQVDAGSPTTGIHNNLLSILSTSMKAFQDDLGMLGVDERVISMTFSEFGRQIASNFAFGTDHGNAAPLMVFGTCVNPVILGNNPEIPDIIQPQEGVPMQFDFRSVYGSVLMDWFEVPEQQVRDLLYEDFQHIPIVQACDVVSTNDPNSFQKGLETYHYPNPFNDWVTIGFTVKTGRVRVSIYDTLGHEIFVVSDQHFLEGTHEVRFESRNLAAGNYYYRIQTATQNKTKPIVKI